MLTSLTTVGEEDKYSSFANTHYITLEGLLFTTHSQSDLPRLTNVYLTKTAFECKKKVTTNSLSSSPSLQLDITPALQKYLDSCVSSKHCHGKEAMLPNSLPFHLMIQLANRSDLKLAAFISYFISSQSSLFYASTRAIPFNPCK